MLTFLKHLYQASLQYHWKTKALSTRTSKSSGRVMQHAAKANCFSSFQLKYREVCLFGFNFPLLLSLLSAVGPLCSVVLLFHPLQDSLLKLALDAIWRFDFLAGQRNQTAFRKKKVSCATVTEDREAGTQTHGTRRRMTTQRSHVPSRTAVQASYVSSRTTVTIQVEEPPSKLSLINLKAVMRWRGYCCKTEWMHEWLNTMCSSKVTDLKLKSKECIEQLVIHFN